MDGNVILIILGIIIGIIAIAFLTINVIVFSYYKKSNFYSIEKKLSDDLDNKLHIINGVNLQKRCNSKQQYDKVNFEKLTIANFIDNYPFYSDKIIKSFHNQNVFNEYMSAHNQAIENEWETNLQYKALNKIALKAFKSIVHNEPSLFSISYVKTYVSPKGKNSYRASVTYDFESTIRIQELAKQAIEYKNTTKYQRQLLNDKLRYQVLQRDGFRCQICGATQNDGVKLHVDHIKPIAKGGKTELSNLRTLCERCNEGKSDSYIEGGMN